MAHYFAIRFCVSAALVTLFEILCYSLYISLVDFDLLIYQHYPEGKRTYLRGISLVSGKSGRLPEILGKNLGRLSIASHSRTGSTYEIFLGLLSLL